MKKNCVPFLLLIMEFLFLDARFIFSYFNKKLRKYKFQFWSFRHKMGCSSTQFLPDLVNFDNICHVLLKINFSFGSNCREKVNRQGVNRRRKDIEVTFVSFGLHARRLQNMEARSFHILPFSYTFC